MGTDDWLQRRQKKECLKEYEDRCLVTVDLNSSEMFEWRVPISNIFLEIVHQSALESLELNSVFYYRYGALTILIPYTVRKNQYCS